MGMTIDVSLNKLQEMYSIMEYEIGLIKEPDEKAWNREFINSLETAIATMRKYQKIEEVIKETDDLSTIRCSISFSRIREVVEDGNDNN